MNYLKNVLKRGAALLLLLALLVSVFGCTKSEPQPSEPTPATGTFLAGCCYGRPTQSFLGVAFSHPAGGAPAGVKLLPVQLFEAGADVLLFALLLPLTRRARSRYDGLAWYCLLYGAARFVLEFFRYDAIRGSALFLSTSQWISLGLWALAGVLFALGKKERKGAAHAI